MHVCGLGGGAAGIIRFATTENQRDGATQFYCHLRVELRASADWRSPFSHGALQSFLLWEWYTSLARRCETQAGRGSYMPEWLGADAMEVKRLQKVNWIDVSDTYTKAVFKVQYISFDACRQSKR